jgi:pyruvate dehydrogenase E1 component alpha subunit
VYESFNMAELWKLPIIFVIENNQYAMGTSVNRASAEDQLYRRGESFRIPGIQVDGMDVLACAAPPRKRSPGCAPARARCILEMKTYRYRGHSMSDPAKYRSREEVQAVRDKSDPIEHRQEAAARRRVVTEDEIKTLDKEIRKIVANPPTLPKARPSPNFRAVYRRAGGAILRWPSN